MSGDNHATRYNDNPYFDGVISPITTQGEVTVNCRADVGEVSQRRANMSKPLSRDVSYPGGDVLEHHHVLPHELVFGWVSKQGRNAIPGHPNQVGFSTMNGIQWGSTTTNEELAMRIRFIGLAKTPFFHDNRDQLKHGFAAFPVGSGTTHHTGELEIYPGDILEWDVIPRPSKPGRPLEGGAYGDDGPGSRQGNPRVGTARGKMRFRINPSRFNDMRPSINAALACARKTQDQGGILDRPFEDLFSPSRRGNSKKPTPAAEHGMALFTTMAITAISAIPVFAEAGLVTWTAGNNELTATEKVGVFATTEQGRRVLTKLIDTWFLDFSANRERSRPNLDRLKQTFPEAFNNQGNRVVRNETTVSRYVQVRTNLANLQELGYARAVNAVGRRRFGMALSYAKKGQGVDVLLGHFLQAQ